MLDSEYFRTTLQSEVEAMNQRVIVKLHLSNREMMYLRAVLTVHNEYVTLEAYQPAEQKPAREPHWKGDTTSDEPLPATMRAVVAYDGMVAVTLIPDGE